METKHIVDRNCRCDDCDFMHHMILCWFKIKRILFLHIRNFRIINSNPEVISSAALPPPIFSH